MIGLVAGSNIGCSRPSSTKEPLDQITGITGRDPKIRTNQILITDPNGQPVPGAQIMIGQRITEPFAGNLIVTDKNGQAQIPTGWTTSLPVTIEASGFVRTTYFARTPEVTRHLKIKQRPVADSSIELKGETQGYGRIRNDGWLDLGLVLPTMSRAQLGMIHITDVFAREVDLLSVLGNQQRIPSNLAVPTQTKTYILPIQFSKPVYRQYFPTAGSYRVQAVHARVNIADMVGELRRGASILELVNRFSFTEVGIRNVTVKRGSTETAIPVNEIKLAATVDFIAPNFNGEMDLFTIAMARSESSYYVSDMKKLTPGERTKLTAPASPGARGMLMHLLRKRTKDPGDALRGASSATMSLALSAPTPSIALDFLEIVPAPVRASQTKLKLSPPRNYLGLLNSMTYVVLSKVEPIGSDNYKLEKTSPEWELYVNDWTTNVDLPEMPSGLPAMRTGQMRWEASFVGQPNNSEQPEPAGPESFEKATHVTRSAVDF
jgi:hypothetical protein